MLILICICPIYKIIAGHNAFRISLFYRNLKACQIYFTQSPLINDTVRCHSSCFLIIYRKMLRTCCYSILLYPTDICGCHFSCQIRIFREIFKISSAERISFHVKSRSKQNIYSKSRCFFSKRFSYFLTECLIPAVCYCCSRWKACSLHAWI